MHFVSKKNLWLIHTLLSKYFSTTISCMAHLLIHTCSLTVIQKCPSLSLAIIWKSYHFTTYYSVFCSDVCYFIVNICPDIARVFLLQKSDVLDLMYRHSLKGNLKQLHLHFTCLNLSNFMKRSSFWTKKRIRLHN